MEPKKAVVVGGYAQGPVHVDEGQTFRFFDIVECRSTTHTDLKNRMVLVYPSQELSQSEQEFWSENGKDGDVSPYINIYGTFEKADDDGNPFAGAIIASKVVSPSRYSER